MKKKNPTVTIVIPNYKTHQLTKACLELLKKYTNLSGVHIIVVDNHSEDDSIEYLRTLDWIELIERTPEPDDNPPLSHARALDLALQKTETPYFLSIHTDTFVKKNGWLDFLLHYFENDKNIAGVGSWKLEKKPWYKLILKKTEKVIQMAWYSIIKKEKHSIEGVGKNYYYLRSHCALYRMDLIKKMQLTFADEKEPAGKILHKKLIDANYKTIFLPSETLSKYIEHINHATTYLNKLPDAKTRSLKKMCSKIKNKIGEHIH